MSAGKTLAVTVAGWIAMGATSAYADPVSSSRENRLWMRYWPAGAVTAYEASAAPAPTNTISNVPPTNLTVSAPCLGGPHRRPGRLGPRRNQPRGDELGDGDDSATGHQYARCPGGAVDLERLEFGGTRRCVH